MTMTPAGKGKVEALRIFLRWLETTPEGRAAMERAREREASWTTGATSYQTATDAISAA